MNAQTRVSAKGQIVIPKTVRDELGWPPGTNLRVERVGSGVTLRPVKDKRGTLTVDEFVARRPKYVGPRLSLEDMEAAMAQGMAERFSEEYKIER